jgi:hypothetical protein
VDLRFLDHRGRETQRLNMRSFLPAVLDDSRGVHVSIRRIAHTLQELEGAPQLTEPFATSAETMLETALFRFVYEVMDHFESSHPTRAQQIERGG